MREGQEGKDAREQPSGTPEEKSSDGNGRPEDVRFRRPVRTPSSILIHSISQVYPIAKK